MLRPASVRGVSEPSRQRRALLAIACLGLALRVYPWFLPHAFLGV
ncbi:MAG: hypothetical protein JWM40_2700, partial [Frankiales bacterium]|nr:hypothetical protein [Frankiales bacterium]